MIKTLPITRARQELPTLVDNAAQKLDEYVVTVRGIPAAVILSVAEYESWKETIEIMGDPGLVRAIKEGREDIKNGRYTSLEDLEKELTHVQTHHRPKSQKRGKSAQSASSRRRI